MDKLPQHIDLSNEARRVAAPFNKARMTKPLPLRSRSFEASSNINSEVESALSAAAGIALTFAEGIARNLKLVFRYRNELHQRSL